MSGYVYRLFQIISGNNFDVLDALQFIEVSERSTDNTGKCAIIYCLLTVLVLKRIACVYKIQQSGVLFS